MENKIFTDYLAVCRMDLSKYTLANYRSSYRAFQSFLDEYQIEFTQITQPDVQAYIASRSDLKTSTLKTQIKAIRAAFNYGRNCTLTIQRYDDPFVRLRYPVTEDADPITFSNEEIKTLFCAIENNREWFAFHLFAYAGLRREEACNLDWEDVDFEQRHLRILGKGNKMRRVPMHPILASALSPYISTGPVLPTLGHYYGIKEPGTRLDPGSLARSTAFWYQRAGIEKGNHCFRRTMNSVLRENGVSTEDRERIMGWSPKDVQGRYYTRFLDDSLHQAILKLDYSIKPKSVRHLRAVA